jgi:glycine cleavage system aminomethyltransferase T
VSGTEFTRSVDLTDDVGATVSILAFWSSVVRLSMGGDLSVSIAMPPSAARELAQALLDATAAVKP